MMTRELKRILTRILKRVLKLVMTRVRLILKSWETVLRRVVFGQRGA
ncbi:MAG: hypothetical protein K9K78_04545 [Spirochaetales bacterium]|nr:hypothetical protein [Spirochaetales bacterium]